MVVGGGRGQGSGRHRGGPSWSHILDLEFMLAFKVTVVKVCKYYIVTRVCPAHEWCRVTAGAACVYAWLVGASSPYHWELIALVRPSAGGFDLVGISNFPLAMGKKPLCPNPCFPVWGDFSGQSSYSGTQSVSAFGSIALSACTHCKKASQADV